MSFIAVRVSTTTANSCSSKQPSPVLPKLRVKIESLVLRFRDSRDPVHHGNVKEIGPSSLPRTTKETNSFLLLSPTDLVILVRTLYPTPARSETSSSPPVDIPIRPRGAAPMGSTSSPPASSRNSPDSPPSPLTASIFTVRSDETGNESLVTSHLDRVVSGHGATRPASLYPHHEQRDSLPTRLGQAVDHLSSLLRERVGTYHPHALDDLWTVVHVSKQGMKLSTRMKGYTGASDESEGVSDSEMDDQDSPVNFLPHRKYHRLKRTVTELVKAYEITPSTGDRTPPEEYSSNLARLKQSNFQLETVTVRSKSSQGSSNPYHKSSTTSDTAGNHPRSRQNPTRQNSAKSTLKSMQPGNSLTQMLNFAKQQCLARGEFGLAHRYNDGIEQLQALPTSLRRDDFSPLLTVFVRGGKEASIAAHNSMEEHDASFFWLEQSQQQQEAMIDEISHVIDCLRLKLWYDIEVRNSEPYATFKNVAIAMRTMGQWLSTDSTNPAWGWSEKAFRATMDKMSDIEREVFELMAAPAEEGGPTKLANDQVDMVKTWLHQQDIWNACPAEERLHRFCLAIVRFQHRIIGDKRNNWSYLRSSATYRQEITQVAADSRLEEKELDMRSAGLPERQMGVNSDVKDKGSEDWDTLTSAASSRPDGPRNAQENPIAPRGPNRNPSFVSDKSKVSSPPATGRSSMSAPMTSSDAVQVKPQEQPRARKSGAQIEPAPPAFIRNLSEGLISLLLSELGPIAFESGSETDSWLTCQYSEECFGRLLERQRKNQEQVHGQKSLTLLHKAYLSKAREGVSSRPKQTDRQLPLEHAAPQYRPDPRLESFARRSTSPVQEQPQHLRMGLSARRSALFDFPYNLAFTRLFAKFATHPSPFVKLHTLYEIHQLIIARLKSQNSRSDMDSDSDTQGRRSRKGSCSRSSEAGIRRKIAAGAPHTKAKSHRGSVRSEKQGSTGNGSNEDAYSEYAGSEDDVHSSLYDLLKSADMRPATFYRDLQYIASIVPRYILDRSARGDTFWVFAKVALMLKTDICLTMVEISTELLSFYLERQRADKAASSMSETASVAESVSAISLAASDLASHYSIIDVANMWVITAMEGNTLGQRELALMYIRFPEVMPTVTPPLTRAGDIITPAILASRKANAATNRSSNERNGHDLEMKREAHKHDPVPMALALAWTILSAEGGDAVAKHYVRQRKGGIVGNLRLAVEV